MTTSDAELQRLLSRAHALAIGPARFAALDVVLRHADAAGEVKFAFDVRMNAMSDFEQGGDQTRLFLAFSWCLSMFDRHPEIVGAGHARSLLWRYKWVVNGLGQFPEVPLEQTYTVLDDMQRRYQLGGHSLHAVYQHRWVVASHVGDPVAAQQWYERMLSAPRDGLSDCEGCVPTCQVDHLAWLGRYDEAIELGEKVKSSWCWSQPQAIKSALLNPYVMTGRLDKAVEAHRDSYWRMRDQPRHLIEIACHLMFCGMTGNEARGLEIIERHLGWLEKPCTPAAAMDFVSAAALVLNNLTRQGKGDLTVRRRREYEGATQVAASELAAEMAAHARDLGQRFDARNGNTFQSRRVEERIAAQAVGEHAPLTVLGGRVPVLGTHSDQLRQLLDRVAEATAAGDHQTAAVARLDVAYALRNASQWEDAVETAEEAVRSLDRVKLDERATHARYLLWQLYERAYHHRESAAAILEEILAAPILTPPIPPLPDLLETAAQRDHTARGIGYLRSAAEHHRTAGDVEGEVRTLRKALAKLGATASPEAGPILDRLDQLLDAEPLVDANERAQVDVIACRMFLATDRAAQALTRIDRAVNTLSGTGSGAFEAAVLLRAETLLALGEYAEAEAAARDLALNPQSEWSRGANLLVAKALKARGLHDKAQAHMNEHDIDEVEIEDEDE